MSRTARTAACPVGLPDAYAVPLRADEPMNETVSDDMMTGSARGEGSSVTGRSEDGSRSEERCRATRTSDAVHLSRTTTPDGDSCGDSDMAGRGPVDLVRGSS